jgi:hypothetical protein
MGFGGLSLDCSSPFSRLYRGPTANESKWLIVLLVPVKGLAGFQGLRDRRDDEDREGGDQEDEDLEGHAACEFAISRITKHVGEVPRSVDDADHMDSIGGWLVEDDVRPHGKSAQLVSQIVTPLSDFGLIGEQLERVQHIIEHPFRGCRIVGQNRIANGV